MDALPQGLRHISPTQAAAATTLTTAVILNYGKRAGLPKGEHIAGVLAMATYEGGGSEKAFVEAMLAAIADSDAYVSRERMIAVFGYHALNKLLWPCVILPAKRLYVQSDIERLLQPMASAAGMPSAELCRLLLHRKRRVGPSGVAAKQFGVRPRRMLAYAEENNIGMLTLPRAPKGTVDPHFYLLPAP